MKKDQLEAELYAARQKVAELELRLGEFEQNRQFRLSDVDSENKSIDVKRARLIERLNLATQSASLGIWDWDILNNELVWDDQMYALYGLDPEKFVGAYEAWLNCIHPDDYKSSNEISQQAVRGEREYDTEFRVLWPDESVHWLKAKGQVIRDDRGVPIRMVGVNYEITEHKKAEAALRESEERFSTAFHTSPVPQSIITLGTSEIMAVNDACCQLFDYSRDELIGATTSKLRLWENPVDRQAAVEELRTTGHMLPQETTVRTKTGDTRTLIAAIEPIMWKGIPCLISSMFDITERKRIEKLLQEGERSYRELVQNANSAIIRWNRYGAITFFNEFAESFFGHSSQDVLGKHVNILMPETESTGDDLSKLVENIVAHPEQFLNVVNENICKDGHRVWMVWTNKPVYDENGQLSEILAVGVDITERKHMENELRRSNTELEQFAYVASHDLQEPLRTVAGMVQLLQKKYQGQLDERADEYIRHAVEAASRMQALINDLLTYSRVARRGKELKSVNVGQVLAVALSNLQVAIRETGAEITYDEMPTVLADSTQLAQLFQNLIGNALKFRGQQPPKIQIYVKKLAGSLQFSVCDNGIGIERQYFERIFLVFQRLHTHREYPGTGIGLALCQKIIERHGGNIWVESEPGQGAKFHFTLPAVPSVK